MVFTKGTHQRAKCQIFDCSGEIPPNLYFDRLLLLKVYKTSAKKKGKGYFSWYRRVVHNLKKNWFFVSKRTRIWWIWIEALKSLKNVHFDWFLLCKVYNAGPKKIQRSYIWWHWRVMQNLKKNRPVVWKIAWGIWQVFIGTLETVKIGTFMGFFCPK